MKLFHPCHANAFAPTRTQRTRLGCSTLLLLLLVPLLSAAERPNILWITSEDNSAYYVGCYGNPQALTPNIDRLAREGHRYTRAFANAPVCAVARSTLLTGVYAVTQGTHHMRSRYPIPFKFRPYVAYLREAGYYCTNNEKTDYNFRGNDVAFWDACSRDAHYENRAEGQPFFAIFNFNSSHEHTLFPQSVERYRAQGVVPETNRIDPSEVEVPPLYPDVPEIRQDLANYYDAITRMDGDVGRVLAELEASGEADNTIIFYYSDHGGVLPRSKRYVYETGTRVPLVVYFPEKWQHLAPGEPGEPVDTLVSFIDFAPTLLSLTGLDVPEHMMGRLFLGRDAAKSPADSTVFLFGDRFDEFYKLNRAITDGRYRYVRNFLPHQTPALRNAYPFQMPAWNAHKAAWQAGLTDAEQSKLWASTQPTEELFDTANDPWELHNLAADPAHRERLASMREQLRERMQAVGDLGLIPEAMFEELEPVRPIYFYANSAAYPAERALHLAFAASDQDTANASLLLQAARDSNPVVRYWGIMGLLMLGDRIDCPSDALMDELTSDAFAANRIRAAQLRHLHGQRDAALDQLLGEIETFGSDAVLTLALNVISEIGENDALPDPWLSDIAGHSRAYDYAARLAQTVLENR